MSLRLSYCDEICDLIFWICLHSDIAYIGELVSIHKNIWWQNREKLSLVTMTHKGLFLSLDLVTCVALGPLHSCEEFVHTYLDCLSEKEIRDFYIPDQNLLEIQTNYFCSLIFRICFKSYDNTPTFSNPVTGAKNMLTVFLAED